MVKKFNDFVSLNEGNGKNLTWMAINKNQRFYI